MAKPRHGADETTTATGPAGGASASPGGSAPKDGSASPGGHGAPAPTPAVCTVSFCPICLAVTVLGDLSPELLGHLLASGREMLLAVRTVIDQRLETMEEEPAKLQRITIE